MLLTDWDISAQSKKYKIFFIKVLSESSQHLSSIINYKASQFKAR